MNHKNKLIHSVGVLFCSIETQRHLFLLKNDRKNPVWELPGGKLERGETLKQALERECTEEIGFWPSEGKLFPIEQFTSTDERFFYHTFYCFVDKEFIPILNHEHVAYCWTNKDFYPKPLHSGLFTTLNYKTIVEKIQILHDSIK